jgi:hypothetical protein
LSSPTDPATQPSAVNTHYENSDRRVHRALQVHQCPSAASWDDLLTGVAAPRQLDEAAQLDAAVDEIGF